MELPSEGDELFTDKEFYMSSKRNLSAKDRGFTILELMIVMVVVAVGVALATPYYQDVMQRRETTSQAESLVAFVSFAQSEAIKYNEIISVHLTYTDAKDWCIGANEGNAACDCTETNTLAPNFCSLNGVAKILRSPQNTRISMTPPATDRTFAFDPVRGTMTSAYLGNDPNMILDSDNGNWSLEVDIEETGRILICNWDPDKAVPGYQAC